MEVKKRSNKDRREHPNVSTSEVDIWNGDSIVASVWLYGDKYQALYPPSFVKESPQSSWRFDDMDDAITWALAKLAFFGRVA